jgi:hypothetical protein
VVDSSDWKPEIDVLSGFDEILECCTISTCDIGAAFDQVASYEGAREFV